MTRTFVLANSNSYVAANKGVAIVNIHRDTRSGGDTNDTVMSVVVVTIVGSSAISGENVRDFGNSRMSRREGVGIRETCRRYTLPVVLRRTYTEDAPLVVDRTILRHSDTHL